jgi:hypothetical protein
MFAKRRRHARDVDQDEANQEQMKRFRFDICLDRFAENKPEARARLCTQPGSRRKKSQ